MFRSNTDIITNDHLPYIGKIKDDLYIGTGYNTWGLATSVLASKIIFDIISDNKNPYIDLFNPTRMNVDQIIKPFSNILKNINGYIKGFKNTDNKTIKCPHMGCNLLFNSVEKTYDCPCHGSRFDSKGHCIQSPSNKDIKLDN